MSAALFSSSGTTGIFFNYAWKLEFGLGRNVEGVRSKLYSVSSGEFNPWYLLTAKKQPLSV